MRDLTAILVGLGLWALLYWLMAWDTSTPRVLPLEAIGLLRVFYATIFPMLLSILPPLVCGLLAKRAPVFSGAIVGAASAVAAFIGRAGFDFLFAQSTSAFAIAVAGFGTGAAGAALGVLLARSNKSFKPNPLRGSA